MVLIIYSKQLNFLRAGRDSELQTPPTVDFPHMGLLKMTNLFLPLSSSSLLQLITISSPYYVQTLVSHTNSHLKFF
jgi:hypothetical protein